MKDLKSQLEGMGFQTSPAAPESPARVETPVPAILRPNAHRQAEWWVRAQSTQVEGAPKRSRDAALHAAVQQTDGLLKALKRAGRKRDASEIEALRSRWLGDRADAAWKLVKAELAAHGASDRVYRALKQSGGDAVSVWERMNGLDADAWSWGADRLRDRLLGR